MVRAKLAGTWYEADPAALRAELRSWLSASTDEPPGDVLALILPHAGYRYSGPTAARGVALVRGRTYERVIVLAPSHRFPLRDRVALPEGDAFVTPLGRVPFDAHAFESLLESPVFEVIPRAHRDEHAIEIQLPLLQEALPPFALLPLVVGDLHGPALDEVVRALGALVNDDTLVVASSDFTHFGWRFGYEPFRTDVLARIEELDMGAFARIERIDPDGFAAYIHETGATVCGRRPIEILLRMLPASARARLLAYETSGRLTQDLEHSVSYLAASFEGTWATKAPGPGGLSQRDGATLLALARAAIDARLRRGSCPAPESLGLDLPPALRRPGGAFVTLRRRGVLRGCIGHVGAEDSLASAVVESAVGAATGDRRFPAVAADELERLTIAVSVLTEPTPVARVQDLRLGMDGIILQKDGRTALFLPDVAAEQGWDLETTLTHLCRKVGLPDDAWREGARFEAFQAQKFEEAAR